MVLTCIVVIGILLLLLCALGFFFANFSMSIRRQTLEDARTWQENHYDLSWYDPLEKTDYTVTSYDRYILHVQFLRNPESSGRYVLISHGYTDNRFGALKYAKLYLDQGFSIIIYDLRGHGLNEPTFCSYSVRERKDLMAVIRDSRQRYPDMQLLGLHGESLGAATSIAVLEEKPPVDFVVADCGFCDIVPVLKGSLRKMRFPAFLVNVASVCARLRFGFSYGTMKPVNALKENQIPILFIHGADDDLIPPEHSEKMKAKTRGYAEICLIPGAGHAASVLTDPSAYKSHVSSFLTKLFPEPNSPDRAAGKECIRHFSS